MNDERPIYEDEGVDSAPDPDEIRIEDRKLVTQRRLVSNVNCRQETPVSYHQA